MLGISQDHKHEAQGRETTIYDVGTPFRCATVDYPGAEKDKGPLVIRPRKEAPKERLEILGR